HLDCEGEQRRQPAAQKQTEDQDLQRSLVVEPVAHSVPAFFAGMVSEPEMWSDAATSPLGVRAPAPRLAGSPGSSRPVVRSPIHSALTLVWSTLVRRERR